jgi:hypothetical protein
MLGFCRSIMVAYVQIMKQISEDDVNNSKLTTLKTIVPENLVHYKSMNSNLPKSLELRPWPYCNRKYLGRKPF